MTPFFPGLFDLRGVAFAAWTLAAFAIGGLAGLLIRRVVPAIAATLAAYAGLAFAAGGFLRQHYLAPLVTSQPERARLRVDHEPVVDQGRQSSRTPRCHQTTPPADLPHPSRSAGQAQGRSPRPECLSQHGYTQWTSYQPGSRFWPFQWIEGGWLLALSVLLIAATVWLVRRRAT